MKPTGGRFEGVPSSHPEGVPTPSPDDPVESAWREPPGGWIPATSIGKPITDDEVRALGFEPGPRWRPLTDDARRRIAEADDRRTTTPRPRAPVPISGDHVECIVCGADAEPSAVGTPTCSGVCSSVLAERLFADVSFCEALRTRADGDGGLPPAPVARRSVIRTDRPRSPRAGTTGESWVGRALDRLGSCAAVLERHGHRVRGRMARCVFHDDRTPSMSLHDDNGHSRFHCHGCGEHGDAIDLEAALAGNSITDVIRAWGGG